ncbi:metal-dependent hydrolase [Longimicrobium sp.]|uniref:metal-dependent hydrolase n=1 Tax=Longimicrobium sp. TaxID=2029185 RepID=UPI002BFCE240|nr:metal-dependent hydrolase [Longimicrobium sp.]HSU16848.1 metal-dependent hydrolase [Longimicrobium sp.]
MATLTWHGHSCFTLVTDEGKQILIDPWIDENPMSDIKTGDIEALDYILVSHGHSDHFADVVKLAKKTNATVISTFELVAFTQSQGAKNGHGMNIGGAYVFDFGRVKLTPALHTGSIDGDDGSHTTDPAGFLISLNGGQRIYHAGDTALIMDMQLLHGSVDVAILPIGDNFTMGPEDAARAVEMIEPEVVIPMHYNTFPVIEQNPEGFRTLVGDRAKVVILQPGESFTV